MCQIVKNKNSRQVKPWKYKKGTQNNFNLHSCVNNLKHFIFISSITTDGRLTVKMEKKKRLIYGNQENVNIRFFFEEK